MAYYEYCETHGVRYSEWSAKAQEHALCDTISHESAWSEEVIELAELAALIG